MAAKAAPETRVGGAVGAKEAIRVISARKIRTLLWGVVGLCLAAGMASCGSPTASQVSPRTMNVSGVGRVNAAPDLAVVTLGIETTGSDLARAVQESNALAKGVFQAVRGLGVVDADVQTVAFNVSQRAKVDENGNPTTEMVYVVDNTVQVNLRDVQKLGDLLQQSITGGANVVQGVSYTVSDPTESYDQARKLAMENAQRQADALAAASGVGLGGIRSIQESSNSLTPVYVAPSYGKGGGPGVPTSPGTLSFEVQLSITYEIN